MSGPDLPPAAFAKQDTGDDRAFYAPPRLVTHIDDAAIVALTGFYATELAAGDRVLDLMSSWVSHLPAEPALGEVVGHGMNAVEMAANPRLDRWWLQDLNADPALPAEDGSFDAVLICVGVQYLQRPVEVLAAVRRVLRPGGRLIASYSNRCFPTKAVAIWQALDLSGRAGLIRMYLERAGFDAVDTHLLADGTAGDPLVAVVGRV